MEECQLGMEAILGNPLAPRFNVYDIREKCDKPPLCYDFSPADTMFKDAAILKVLGVEGRSWAECTNDVHMAMLPDYMLDLSDDVGALLNSTLDVLVYSGDKDFICNWRGGEKWTNETNWTGKTSFQKEVYQKWGVNSTDPTKSLGALKVYENLKFLRIFDAGHMVPMN